MGIRSSLLTQKRNRKDNCPICKKSLYLNNKVSQRVGILNEYNEVEEWMCPFCDSTFTLNDKPTCIHSKLYGKMDVVGEA